VTSDLEIARQRFVIERARFAELAQSVHEALEASFRRAGVAAMFQSRAKDVGSLVKKMARSGKSYRSIRDKAGVRARLLYPDDRAKAIELVRATLTVVSTDEKRENRDHRTFDYAGTHFIVRLAKRSPVCEVQIHSPGEGLWASVAHDLIYKDQHDVPTELRRAMHRLCAMTELFDDEVSRVRKRLSGADHDAHALLFELERLYLGLTTVGFDKQLSLAAIPLLRGILQESVTSQRLDEFVHRHQSKLSEVFSTRAPESDPLLYQPESLLIFLAIEADQFFCADSWPIDTLPYYEREHFEEVWGKIA